MSSSSHHQIASSSGYDVNYSAVSSSPPPPPHVSRHSNQRFHQEPSGSSKATTSASGRWQKQSMKNWDSKKFDRPITIDSHGDNDIGVWGAILRVLSIIIIVLTMPFSLAFCVKVVQEYERVVVFRTGRLVGAKGPGIFFIIPCIDSYGKVDLRVLSFDVPPQEILSKDSVTVSVDAVVYFRISNAIISITNVEDAARSTKLLAQTTLRNILGTKSLAEMLSERDNISLQMQQILDDGTDSWGVKVERVEVKDVRLPHNLQRAMAAEAEASRVATGKVIAAEGEKLASRALHEAADIISQSPCAIQLRYLQTLSSISAEKNSTIVFPFPVDLLRNFVNYGRQKTESEKKPPPTTIIKPLASTKGKETLIKMEEKSHQS